MKQDLSKHLKDIERSIDGKLLNCELTSRNINVCKECNGAGKIRDSEIDPISITWIPCNKCNSTGRTMTANVLVSIQIPFKKEYII